MAQAFWCFDRRLELIGSFILTLMNCCIQLELLSTPYSACLTMLLQMLTWWFSPIMYVSFNSKMLTGSESNPDLLPIDDFFSSSKLIFEKKLEIYKLPKSLNQEALT